MYKNAIPIVILHRNEFTSLFAMLDSIIVSTKIPYRIFVVDNASSVPERDTQFQKLREMPNLTLIESRKNNWVLGFNEALHHPDWPKAAPYYVFSDADIVVPERIAESECWLTYLVQQMNSHACIGKLGMSLRTDDIDNPVLKESVNRQKQRFLSNPRIGSNIIAPVDTTLAIYRTDFFLGAGFRFDVGHASLTRPHYYTCRTDPAIEAVHLGWYQTSSLPMEGQLLSEKIRCFAKFGGYIEPEVLQRCRASDRTFYKIMRPLSLLFWGSNVVFSNLRYLVSKFPRNVNVLQSACR